MFPTGLIICAVLTAIYAFYHKSNPKLKYLIWPVNITALALIALNAFRLI